MAVPEDAVLTVVKQPQLRFPYFFVTAPTPCPYLPGRLERKIFTRLSGENAQALNDTLGRAGFRRSQGIAYKPACEGCTACQSVRIPVERFSPTRWMRRVSARNADLTVHTVPAIATEEQFCLLQDYLHERHAGGGMADMDAFDFAAMIEDSPIETHVREFRLPDGRLIAACLTDVVGDGLSLVYSFFSPAFEARSLGSQIVLSAVAEARRAGLPHVYLGYWIDGCRKMSYKTRFAPLEILRDNAWRPMTPQPATPYRPPAPTAAD